MSTAAAPQPDQQQAGIPGFPGPFEVGRYAHDLRGKLRSFTRVALVGEVLKVRIGNTESQTVYISIR